MWGEVFHRPDPPVFTDQQFQTHFTCCGPLVITWRVTSAAYVFLCMNRRVCSAFVGLKQYSVRSQHSGFGRSPGRLSVCSVFLTLSLFRRTHTCCVFHGGADDFTQTSCQIRAKGKERKPGRILLFLLVTFSHVPFTIGSSHDLHFKYFTMGLSHDLHSTSFLSYEKHVTLWQRMIQIRTQR